MWHTFRGPNERRVALDHVLVPKHMVDRCAKPRAYQSVVPSDHLILQQDIKIAAVKKCTQVEQTKRGRAPRRDLRQFRTAAGEHAREYLAANLPPPTIAAYGTFVSTAAVAAQLLPDLQRTKRKKRSPSEELRRVVLLTTDTADEKARAVQERFELIVANKRNINMKHVEAVCADVERLLTDGDAAEAYFTLKSLTRKRGEQADPTKIDGGLDAIRDTCAAQVTKRDCTEDVEFQPRHVDPSLYKTGSFGVVELVAALRQISTGKAAGIDNVSNEMLKTAIDEGDFQSYVLELMNDCLREGATPDLFRQTRYVMIKKPLKKHTKADGWRYIALMSAFAKLYDRMLLNRLLPGFNAARRPNQHGFRTGRSTLQHVLALRQLIEQRTAEGLETTQVFVDYESAFPSVSWQALEAAFMAFSVPAELQRAFFSMYRDHRCEVSTAAGPTAKFRPTCGVLQGDTAAPALFTLVLDCVLHDTLDQATRLGIKLVDTEATNTRGSKLTRLTDLDFADDIVLLTESRDDAQQLFSMLEKLSRKCGLKVNASKTKTLYTAKRDLKTRWKIIPKTNTEPEKKVLYFVDEDVPVPPLTTCLSDELEYVSEYVYLGVNSDVDSDLVSRIGMGWTAFNKLNHIWRAEKVPLALKHRLLNTFVVPAMMYGAATYPMTEARIIKLRGATTRMLRRMSRAEYDQHLSLKTLYCRELNSPTQPFIQLHHRAVKQQLNLVRTILRNDFPIHTLILLNTPEHVGRSSTLRKTIRANLAVMFPDEAELEALKHVKRTNDRDWKQLIDELVCTLEENFYAKRDHISLSTNLCRNLLKHSDAISQNDIDQIVSLDDPSEQLRTLAALLGVPLESLCTNCTEADAKLPLAEQMKRMIYASTDGSVMRKGKPTECAGYGIYYLNNLFDHRAVNCKVGTTINQCELRATTLLLRTHPDDPICQDLDSDYVQRLARRMQHHTMKGIHKRKNKDDIIEFYNLLKKRDEKKLITIFRKVASHTGNIPNECADILAKAGAVGLHATSPIVLSALAHAAATGSCPADFPPPLLPRHRVNADTAPRLSTNPDEHTRIPALPPAPNDPTATSNAHPPTPNGVLPPSPPIALLHHLGVPQTASSGRAPWAAHSNALLPSPGVAPMPNQDATGQLIPVAVRRTRL